MPIRGGIAVWGTGEDDVSCDGECTGFTSNPTDYDHKVAFGFGIDFLGAIGNLVRLGGGLFYVAPYEVEIRDADFELGSDLSTHFVFEMTPEVGPSVWLVPRLQLGLTLLFPSGDGADRLESLARSCEAAGASGCDDIEGVKPGVNYGIGLGVLTGGSVRFRADLMFQGYIVNVYNLEFDTPNATVSDNLYGNRFFVLAGIEI